MIELDAAEARRLRARSHLLAGSALSPAEVVVRAGALQGQELPAVLRAIALRSRPGTTAEDVRAAFDRGELVRGWPMRGTLFALDPLDLAGFVRLTGPRLTAAIRTRRAYVGITDADFDVARGVAEAALAERPRTREELAAMWADAGVPQVPGIAYHLTSTLAIHGVLHLGRFEGGPGSNTGSHTRDQLVEAAATSDEEDSAFLARIARAFFVARGPVPADDLAWWTKLPKGMLKPAIESIEGLETVSVEGRPMRFIDDGAAIGELPAEFVVPAFDEWLLGYSDRSLVATPEALAAIITKNGIFRPARLVAGLAVEAAAR